jgi:hypothetical protein
MLAELTRIEHEAQIRGLHNQIGEMQQQQARARKERSAQMLDRSGLMVQLKASQSQLQPSQKPQLLSPAWAQHSAQSMHNQQSLNGRDSRNSETSQPRSPPEVSSEVSTHEQEVLRFKRDLDRSQRVNRPPY